VSANAFRIAVLDETSSESGTREIPIIQGQQNSVSQIVQEIERVASPLRAHFVSAESAAQVLAKMDPNVAQWLKTRFSLTDLKFLFRSVAGPDEDEFFGSVSSPPERTVRHAEWLLLALAFFEPANGLKTADLTRGLRELQIAKSTVLAGSPPRSTEPVVDQKIVAGGGVAL